MSAYHNREIRELGKLLLDIGALLMGAGANTHRIRLTTNRIANAFGYSAELFITHRALTLTLNDARDGEKAGRSLSTGLDGWRAALHASGKSAAELAKDYRLPEDYIAAVLAEPLEADVAQ